jgi:hypothetical protein
MLSLSYAPSRLAIQGLVALTLNRVFPLGSLVRLSPIGIVVDLTFFYISLRFLKAMFYAPLGS